jgi:hypothetical protein
MKTVTYNGNRIEVIYQRNGTTILDITKWHIHDLSSVQVDLTFSAAKDIFKKSHIKQVLKMVREEIKREPVEFRIKSIEDLTKEKCS